MSQNSDENNDLHSVPPVDAHFVQIPTQTMTNTLLSLANNHPPPPSSLHGEIDEDDDKLPVDDLLHQRSNASNDDEINENTVLQNNNQDVDGALSSTEYDPLQPSSILAPQQPELTMKEKLVLRERQHRIESERARLKRHFALSSTNDESDNIVEGDGMASRNYNSNDVTQNRSIDAIPRDENDVNVNDREFEEESTRAHPDEDEDEADEASRRLGFNMERFLRNSENFNPEVANILEPGDSATESTKGVVMERFLNDIAETVNFVSSTYDADEVVDLHNGGTFLAPTVEPHRSVSFDVDATILAVDLPHSVAVQSLELQQQALLALTHHSFGDDSAAGTSLVSNASTRTEANTLREDLLVEDEPQPYSAATVEPLRETDQEIHDEGSSRISDDEPRVLRLTEADMLEMAAIEEASIGNAPPSDRDDVESYSEIGELADFGASGSGMHRFLSDPTFAGPDTPTTALESASQLSTRSLNRGVASAVSSSSATNLDVDIVTGHMDIMDGIQTSVSAVAHDFLASASVAANPPSDGGCDDEEYDTIDAGSQMNDGNVNVRNESVIPFEFNEVASSMAGAAAPFRDDLIGDTLRHLNAQHIDSETLTNRQRQYNINCESVDGSKDESVDLGGIVDGFDFDKNEPSSPFDEPRLRGNLLNDDSFRNLPSDPWSPQGQMQISPLQVSLVTTRQKYITDESNETISHNIVIPMPHEMSSIASVSYPKSIDDKGGMYDSDATPLLGAPIESSNIGIPRNNAPSESHFGGRQYDDCRSDTIFRDFSARQVTLLMTLVLEVPVLFLILGGFDNICSLIGKTRYHLLLGFLPLTCAISGHVGQQASKATTQGILDGRVTEVTFRSCFMQEGAGAICHGIVIGFVVGMLAYITSVRDFEFSLTVAAVQVFSVMIAGVVGTVTPYCLSSFLNVNLGDWSGLLVTAIQDIFGSFVIIYLSFYMLVLFTAREVDPLDRCVSP